MAFNSGGSLGSAPIGKEPASSAGTPKPFDGAIATGPLGSSPLAASILSSVNPSLSLAATEAKDTASFAANGIAVNLAATEAKDVASFVAWNTNAVLAATDAPDTAAAAIDLFGFFYVKATDAVDTASFNISNYNLALIATEASDTAVFNASISSTLSMAAIETPDSYAQNAYILWLTPTQPDDPTIWVPKNDPAPYLTTVI